MEICVLGSGSGGNATLIKEGRGRAILIDAGLSYLQVGRELKALGIEPQEIEAILITHEHADHCCEVGLLARRLGCPIYGTERTLRGLGWLLGGLEELRPFALGEELEIGGLRIESFPVFHDALEPCGYLISSGEGTVGLATDLGVVTRTVMENLARCDVVILEANHDLEMLRNGPYPWELKQRIRSEVGHLSNEACGEALTELARRGRLRTAFLAHLSRTNNRPELALETVQSYLNGRIDLHLTWQDQRSETLSLKCK
ncbi:TPA: MBL fold metallo-hydrolase [Candidatus Bipolaricaulota bacterium]|nr:MBL fold metallo-hydrolase [Candidatus Bipolaricaulota bacterium]